MSTKQNTKLVSYRRNRDYTKHFEWTYKLNRDVYRCIQYSAIIALLDYNNALKEF